MLAEKKIAEAAAASDLRNRADAEHQAMLEGMLKSLGFDQGHGQVRRRALTVTARRAVRRPRCRDRSRRRARLRRGRRGAGRRAGRRTRPRNAATAIASISSRALARRRRSSSPEPTRCAGARPSATRSSSTPSPLDAIVVTIGGFHGRSTRRDHVPQLADRGWVPSRSALFTTNTSRDLQDARLGRLDRRRPSRARAARRGVGERGDVDLGLADADRLDDDHLAARRVEHPQRLRASPRPARRDGRGWPST